MIERNPEIIPLDKCERGWLYHAPCRNANIGVYDGNGGFIISRFKFHPPRCLFTELHRDASKWRGTCTPLRKLEQLPQDILLIAELGTFDGVDRTRMVAFDETRPFRERWYYVDNGLSVPYPQRPTRQGNPKLLAWLDERIGRYPEEWEQGEER